MAAAGPGHEVIEHADARAGQELRFALALVGVECSSVRARNDIQKVIVVSCLLGYATEEAKLAPWSIHSNVVKDVRRDEALLFIPPVKKSVQEFNEIASKKGCHNHFVYLRS